MNKRPTQRDRILKYMLDFGSITQREAMNDLGVMRLASRIHELKELGYVIKTQDVAVVNRYGEKTMVAQYTLVPTC